MSAVAYRFRIGQHWALAAGLFLGAFALGLTAIADGDIWWHLAAGREMWRAQSLLHVDPFSVSAAGRPWVDVHWLFQLALYGGYRLGGLAGLVLAKSALIASGAMLLLAAFRRGFARRMRAPFVVGFLLVLFLIREQLQLRPVIPTLVCLAFFFLKLERFRAEPSLLSLWPLPLAQVVWANTQGLFLLGPGLLAAYALAMAGWSRFGDRPWFPFAAEMPRSAREASASRSLLIALAACLFACALTPFGAHALSLPAHLLGRVLPASSNVFSANVAENVPPFASERLLPGQFFHLKWFFAALFLCLVAPGRRLRLSHVLVLCAFVVLALCANRNVVLLYWLATPIAALSVAPSLARFTRFFAQRRAGLPGLLLGYAAFAAVLSLIGTAAARETALDAPAPFRVPTESAQRIAAAGDRGTIFAADGYGGYLIWKLFPEHRPYIDTRLILRTPAEYSEYLGVVDEPSSFDAFQRRHRFDYVVLPTAYPDRYLGLIAHLYRSPEWKLVYTDGTETLFVVARNATAEPGVDLGLRSTTTEILSSIERRYARAPAVRDAARMQLGTLEIALDQPAEAEHALVGLVRPEARALRARCLLARGDTERARAVSLSLLEHDGDDVQSLNLLAVLSLERGDAHEALSLLKRALAIDPFDAEAERILSSLEDQQHVESP